MNRTETVTLDEKKEAQIKKTAYAIVWLSAALFFYFAVIRGVFGGTVWDRGIYVFATIAFVLLLSYGIHILSFSWIISELKNKENRRDFIQWGCYALICLMTLYYYNSSSEYGHMVGSRYMNFAFALAILCMYEKKEVKTRITAVYTVLIPVLFLIGAVFKDLDLKYGYLYGLSAFVVWIYAILLTCLARRIKNREIRENFSAYGCLTAVFFVLLLVFKNTRTWPFSVVIPFGTLYLHRLDNEKTDRLLRNFCYGCILAFWLMFGTAILFRPYYSFEFTRYPSWFSSVASAGLFWLLVFGCTVSAMLAKMRKTKKIRHFYFEFLTLGAVSAHILMSASRTSLLTVTVLCVTAFILVEAVEFKDTLKGAFYKMILVIGPALLVFPVVYTLTRCVPAVVGLPVRVTRAEWFSDKIERNEPVDSTKFMNIAQYAETFLEKILGVDINLTAMTGAESGPGDRAVDENGEVIFNDNVIGTHEMEGQVYTVKDYTFINDDTADASNGRFDIFRLYFNNLNLTGHDTMIVENSDIILYHAHNSYMQVAYDHGIPAGILFLFLVAGGFFAGILYYKRNYRQVSFAILPVVVVISFMIAGMTEWIFHPSIPIGFAFLFVLTPLMSKSGEAKIKNKKVKYEKGGTEL